MRYNNKKGNGALVSVISSVLVLVVLGIILSMAALTQTKVGQQMTTDSLEYNTTVKSKEGIKVLSDFQPTFGTIIAIGAVIGILIAAFAGLLYMGVGRQ